MPAIMSKEFYKGLLGTCKGDFNIDNVAEHLYNELKLMTEIKYLATNLKTALNNEYKEHTIKVNEIKSKMMSVEARCKHWGRIFHSDPSGNGDSHYECTECGKCGKYL